MSKHAVWISICLRVLPLGMILLYLLAATYTFPSHIARADTAIYESIHPHYFYIGKTSSQTSRCQSNITLIRCYAPRQINTAYDIQPTLSAGIDGRGRTIVIIDAYQAPFIQNDLNLFDQRFNLPDPSLNVITPDGLTPFDQTSQLQVGWSSEISLDIEWAHAIAPGATIDLVLAKSSQDPDLISALKYAVDNNLGDVISMSFGEDEACAGALTTQSWHNIFAEASSEHITIFTSSGDSGAAQLNCTAKKYEQAVSSPANDPLVTSVGGTILNADPKTGAYLGEVAWNESTYQSGSGGGFTTNIAHPTYQNHVPAISNFRGVPDVSYNAAINGGVMIVWSEGGNGSGAFYVFGGTSAGTPQWAAIIALGDQQGNLRLGFINPALYALSRSAQYTQIFYDITSGTNTIALPDPTTGQTTTIQGYNCAQGWDPVTGLGSPHVSNLLPALITFTKTFS